MANFFRFSRALKENFDGKRKLILDKTKSRTFAVSLKYWKNDKHASMSNDSFIPEGSS